MERLSKRDQLLPQEAEEEAGLHIFTYSTKRGDVLTDSFIQFTLNIPCSGCVRICVLIYT